MDKFWDFINNTEDSVDLYIKGVIESDDNWEKEYWGEQYTSENRFTRELERYKNIKVINVYINSRGGSVFAACSIYNKLKRITPQINCYVDGIAASSATIILMAADTIYMPENAFLMIHDPTTVLDGNYKKEELESTTQALNEIKEGIIDTYLSRVKLSREEISEMMSKETWIRANRAAEIGFADVILYNKKVEYENKDNRVFVNKLDCGNLQAPFNFKNKLEISNDDFRDDVVKERERMKAIDEISDAIDKDLVEKAKYESNWSAEKLAYEALKNNKINDINIFKNHVEGNKLSGVNKVSTYNNNEDTGKKIDTNKISDINAMFNFIAKTFGRMGVK